MRLFRHLFRVRRRRTLACLTITWTCGLAVLTAACGSTTAPAASTTASPASSPATTPHAASPAGAVQFPATLFGFRQDTSPQAQKLDQQAGQMLGTLGVFAHPHVALYGSMDTGDMFIVAITELTAAASKYSQPTTAASLRTAFLVQGSQDSQSFAAGSPGAVLGCGHVTRSGVTEIICLRYSKTIIGLAVYFNGSASGLTDAAAKTSQAISAITG